MTGQRKGSSVQRRPEFIQVWRNLEWCEAWIGRGESASMVVQRAMKPPEEGGLGLGRTVANRYVGAVLLRLQKEGHLEPNEVKRARMARFWAGQIQRALEAKKTIVLQGIETIEVADPDLRAANEAGKALMQLEGLDK